MADQNQQPQPMTVTSAKEVKLAVVTYRDQDNQEHTQLMVVGDSTVIMLDGRGLGYSTRPEPGGIANKRIADAVIAALKEG